MLIMKNILFTILLCLLVSAYSSASETDNYTLKIKATSSEIKVGEPLILEVSLSSLKPAIDPKTGEIPVQGEIPAPNLFVTKKGQKEQIRQDLTLAGKPLTIFDDQKKGLEYKGSVVVFYNEAKKGLLFNEPGTYICHIVNQIDKIESNSLEINVKPASNSVEMALSILTGESDLMILGWSDESITLKNHPKTEGIMERFEKIVEQCPDTMLAKLAAARLGIEATKDFEEKYGNEKSLEQLRNGEIKEPLIEAAGKYLNIAYQMPEGFPIREAVLEELARVEYLNGQATKVLSLFDELSAKYPKGKYGKRAISDKNDVQDFIKRRPDLFVVESKELQTATKPLGVAMPATVGLAVVVIAAGGCLLYKRKSKFKQT
jgi:hypothetical protein